MWLFHCFRSRFLRPVHALYLSLDANRFGTVPSDPPAPPPGEPEGCLPSNASPDVLYQRFLLTLE